LKVGNKNDRIDARKLADLLHGGHLSSVYHGGACVRTSKELARSYLTITKDLSQVMNRLKAVHRSWTVPRAGKLVYTPRYRTEWLQKLPEAGVRRRALPAARRAAVLTPGRQARIDRGEQETSRSSIATPDSLHPPDSSCATHCPDSDTLSLPRQAATLGLLRFGFGDSKQC
jgi:hypothetical protein